MTKPDWTEVLDDAMAQNEPRPTRRSIAVNYPPELFPHVQEAGRRRGMSMAAFQRRAALAVALYDLGLDWSTEMVAEPPVGSFERPGKPEAAEGRGYGAWEIRELWS